MQGPGTTHRVLSASQQGAQLCCMPRLANTAPVGNMHSQLRRLQGRPLLPSQPSGRQPNTCSPGSVHAGHLCATVPATACDKDLNNRRADSTAGARPQVEMPCCSPTASHTGRTASRRATPCCLTAAATRPEKGPNSRSSPARPSAQPQLHRYPDTAHQCQPVLHG